MNTLSQYVGNLVRVETAYWDGGYEMPEYIENWTEEWESLTGLLTWGETGSTVRVTWGDMPRGHNVHDIESYSDIEVDEDGHFSLATSSWELDCYVVQGGEE